MTADSSSARKRTLATYCVVLQVVGLLLSAQLSANHFSASAPALCEMGSFVSCAAVQRSDWAFVLGLPVAFLGCLVFVIGLTFAGYLAGPWHAEEAEVAAGFFVFSLLGLGGVAYFVAGELAVGALCPLCTAVHVVLVATLALSWKILRLRGPPGWMPTPGNLVRLAWTLRIWLLVSLLVVGTPLVVNYVLRAPDGPAYSAQEMDAFGQCLAKQRWKLFIRDDCPYCVKQKQLLGDEALKHLSLTSCNEGNSTLCEQARIHSFPTWFQKSNSAYTRDVTKAGLQTLEQVAKFSGCKLGNPKKTEL